MLTNLHGPSDSEFMNPEEKARQPIDAMLTASGWEVPSKHAVNLSAARGVAVCELSCATGEPDFTELCFSPIVFFRPFRARSVLGIVTQGGVAALLALG